MHKTSTINSTNWISFNHLVSVARMWHIVSILCCVVAASAFTSPSLHLHRQIAAHQGLPSTMRMTKEGRNPLTGKTLIVQNKGGGHGSIGYHLCKELLTAQPGLEVTVLQDKCDYNKPPFSSYNSLSDQGVRIIDADLTGVIKLAEQLPEVLKNTKFEYIVDNWSKSANDAAMVIAMATASGTTLKQLLFVSSAGMYRTDSGLAPYVETDAVKEDNGIRAVELAVRASGVPYTIIRPQYIYGPLSSPSKRYLDYFTGRVCRKLPIPLPLTGEQLVGLTHVEDVASLLTAAVGHPNAANQIFNCGTDR